MSLLLQHCTSRDASAACQSFVAQLGLACSASHISTLEPHLARALNLLPASAQSREVHLAVRLAVLRLLELGDLHPCHVVLLRVHLDSRLQASRVSGLC